MVPTDAPIAARIVIILLFVALWCYVPIIYLFYQNQHRYPINARLPTFVLFINFSIYLSSFNDVMTSVLYYPCAVREYLGTLSYLTLFTLIDYRFLHLLFQNKITTNVMEQHKDQKRGIVVWNQSWWVRNRFLVAPRTAIWFHVFQTLFWVVIVSFLVFNDPTSWHGPCLYATKPQTIWRLISVVTKVYGFLGAVILGVALWVSGRHDSFSIRQEYFVTLWSTGICLLFFLILTAIGFPTWLCSFTNLIAYQCILLSGTVWPYHLMKRKGKGMTDASGRAIPLTQSSLVDILHLPEGFQMFLAYLESEFSSENLLFWEAVERLKQLDPEASTTPDQISYIYNHYIADSAPCLVNLSGSDRKQLAASLMTLPRFPQLTALERAEVVQHIFEQPQRVIYELMNNDSFPRFRQTEAYKELNLISSHTYKNSDSKASPYSRQAPSFAERSRAASSPGRDGSVGLPVDGVSDDVESPSMEEPDFFVE